MVAEVIPTHTGFYFGDSINGDTDNNTHELHVGQHTTHKGTPYISFEGDLYPYGSMDSQGRRNPAETCYQFTMSLDEFDDYVDALVGLRNRLKGETGE